VKAESRRLMLENIQTEAGAVVEHTFMVNVRTPWIAGTDSIRRKSREYGYLNWDNKLTLEFNGKAPSVAGIRIRKAPDNITTVFLAGNSTVVDQENEPYASWGQMITRFFDNQMVVANYAESGEALISFKGARRLDKILSVMKPGDYLFIQFGHNDQKRRGEGIGPWTSFTDLLNEFVTRAREKGGIPVLVTPMQRRSFNEDGVIVPTHGDYPAALRKVAETQNVPLIDLQKMSKVLYEAWGPELSKKAFVQYPANTFPGQTTKLADNTHFNNYGAYQIALCVIKGIREAEPNLAGHLTVAPEIDLTNPSPFDSFAVPHSLRIDALKPDGN
jgi:lysophospholipase L1-like esterase